MTQALDLSNCGTVPPLRIQRQSRAAGSKLMNPRKDMSHSAKGNSAKPKAAAAPVPHRHDLHFSALGRGTLLPRQGHEDISPG